MTKSYPNLHIIALTGSIGSGKSTAAEIFRELGVVVIDADELAREVVAIGTPALAEIRREFGEKMVDHTGALNRANLRTIVFKDHTSREKLERIVHPKVRNAYHHRLSVLNQQAKSKQLVLYVVPLLFETKNKRPEISTVVVITAPKELCISRAAKRDQLSEDEVKKIYDSQITAEERERRADFVIQNAGGREELRSAIEGLLRGLQHDL